MFAKNHLAGLVCAALLLLGGCAEGEPLVSFTFAEDPAARPSVHSGASSVFANENRGYPIIRSGTSLQQSDLRPIQESAQLLEPGAFSDELVTVHPNLEQDSVSAGTSSSGVDVVSDAAAESSYSVAVSPDFPWPDHMMPYREMLSQADKLVYDEIYQNITNMVSHFPLLSHATPQSISPIVRAVIYDNPDLFWVDSYYQFGYTPEGKVTEVKIAFNDTADYIQSAKASFAQTAQIIIDGASQMESDWEKEKYVHDYLSDLVQYDLLADNNQSAYSALVGRTSVCAGYAKAFQYIMMRLGIPCYYCVGYAGEDHAWNLIQLDGQFYNVDLSWNDPIGNPQGQYNYDYYNLSDADMAEDHTRTEMSIYLPAAPQTAYIPN